MSQLPKQTIERIEREADDYAPYKVTMNYEMAEAHEGYIQGSTREALLVLPVIEAAKEYLETTSMIARQHSGMTEDLHNDLQKAISNYEQGTVE